MKVRLFLAATLAMLAVPSTAGAIAPQMSVTPSTVAAGGTVTVANLPGNGCEGGVLVEGVLVTEGGGSKISGTGFTITSLPGAGDWSVVVTIPTDLAPGTYTMTAVCEYPFETLRSLDAQTVSSAYQDVPVIVTAQQQTSTTTAAPTTSTTAPAPNVVTAAPAYTG